jgi:hypothetical protein
MILAIVCILHLDLDGWRVVPVVPRDKDGASWPEPGRYAGLADPGDDCAAYDDGKGDAGSQAHALFASAPRDSVSMAMGTTPCVIPANKKTPETDAPVKSAGGIGV